MNYRKRIKELKDHVRYKKKNNDFVIINDERAIINVGSENIDDIYSPFCYKGGDTLSSNLVEYLSQKSDAIPLDYDLKIRFHVKDATEEKRKDIQAAVKLNYLNEIRAIEERMHRTTIFSIIFVIIGLFIGLLDLFLLRNFLNYTSYFINIFAWVFTWEGIDAFFLDRRILIQEKIKAYRSAAAKIEIVEFEQY